MKSYVLSAAVAAILAGTFLSCAKKSTEIIIGGVAPLTGEAATFGASTKNGFDLAIEEWNAKGGIDGKMLKLALCVAYGALARCESRGAHYREDFPRRDDAAWLKRSLATWRDEFQTLPELTYEEVVVMRMELPPGWRGYGARNAIEHPATALRSEEIVRIRQAFGHADRYTVQQALMPFEHLLPARLRGRNQRIGQIE